MSETVEHYGPRCPYCGHLHCPDGGPFYEDAAAFGCDSCGEAFKMSVHTETTWTCDFIRDPGVSPPNLSQAQGGAEL